MLQPYLVTTRCCCACGETLSAPYSNHVAWPAACAVKYLRREHALAHARHLTDHLTYAIPVGQNGISSSIVCFTGSASTSACKSPAANAL
jgi:hypothetical protein